MPSHKSVAGDDDDDDDDDDDGDDDDGKFPCRVRISRVKVQ